MGGEQGTRGNMSTLGTIAAQTFLQRRDWEGATTKTRDFGCPRKKVRNPMPCLAEKVSLKLHTSQESGSGGTRHE